MGLSKKLCFKPQGAVEKALFYPPNPPKGGSYNIQYNNKSPLGDLGVQKTGGTFSTAPSIHNLIYLQINQYFTGFFE